MTVKELKERLEKYPDDMEVFLDERHTDFKFGMLGRVDTKVVLFLDDPDGDPYDEDEVVMLTEA